ncbi:hypothetical protein PROFUN_09452 [Planoprotostelium fungivorum]|uniref:Uncharacterized protein n=1 Tax=Planoprotostelium fungivorum TaxID=1890364 RepID=A0A2P6NH07_9EUKA|nr:hypothetical protein PROFUN_09452 [Planoprotostelium fungivorum]
MISQPGLRGYSRGERDESLLLTNLRFFSFSGRHNDRLNASYLDMEIEETSINNWATLVEVVFKTVGGNPVNCCQKQTKLPGKHCFRATTMQDYTDTNTVLN